MIQNQSLIGIPVLVLTLLSASGSRAAARSPDDETTSRDAKPNVVLILADDLGYGDLGCYGSQLHQTPHIDALAESGLRLTDFHSAGPMCSPTRAAMLTGLYQQRFGRHFDHALSGTRHRETGLPHHAQTIAELLKDHGYVTGCFGKWHLGYHPPWLPRHHGFDEFRGLASGDGDYHTQIDRSGNKDWWHGNRIEMESGYTTDLITDHSVDFIERHRDQPFFLYVPHLAIHFPWQGPGDPPHRTAGKSYHDDKWGIIPDRTNVRPHVKAMTEALDRSVARIMAALREHQVTDETLVIFTSDNGGYLTYGDDFRNISSNGRLRGQKTQLYEGGHRVPTIVWWPGRIEPGETDETAHSVDLLPTIAALTGVAKDQPRTDGIDLSPLLLDRKPLPKRRLFWRAGSERAVRDGDWKFFQDGKRIELYNLRDDLGEQRNLANDRAEIVAALAAAWQRWEDDVNDRNPKQTFDLVVYGGTSAGVIAAVQGKRMGLSVALVGPDVHLGGLSSGGLGWTDTGNKAVIGGLAREFYHRIWKHYQQPHAWRWQPRSEYGNRGQGSPAIDQDRRTMWIFEPHVAEQVFDDLVAEHDLPVYRDEWLDRASGVIKQAGRIESIRMLSGLTLRGRMFIDATYEGDLLAAAGVDYHVGRESQDQYGEQWNGVQTGVLHHGHHFGVLDEPISPYVVPGDPDSGLLPRISADPPGEYGAADKKVQAYCFRMCLTNDPRNRTAFPKPVGYDAGQYELLLRVLKAGWREGFKKFDPIPNHKTDTNNHGPFSTDNIGFNYAYPEAVYDRRREIIAEHRQYQQGLMYFLANEPRVPADVRAKFSEWGLAADEFTDNGNWPHQIYVREARRMIGQFVMTENELLKKRPTPQSIGMGSYAMDSHNVQRYITPEGHVQNEGDIGVSTRGPYKIAWGSILPKQEQCKNLLVPVCVSASHIAFGSIRMEPVFMILGQSAATTAALALESQVAVQQVSYEKLTARLLSDGQVLEYEDTSLGKFGVDPQTLEGTVIDDRTARVNGNWTPSSSGKSVGRYYLHDRRAGDGRAAVEFAADLEPGRYQVRLAYAPHPNRASNVPVTIRHAGGQVTVKVNQRTVPTIDKLLLPLGEFEFTGERPAVIEISNRETDGYVIADAVQFVRVE